MMRKRGCHSYQKEFSRLRDGALSPETETALNLHIKECNRCAKEWKVYVQALDWMGETRESVMEVPAAVWARFNQQRAKEKKSWLAELKWQEELNPLKWGGALAFGVAACLLLMVFTFQQQQVQETAAQAFLTQTQTDFEQELSLF